MKKNLMGTSTHIGLSTHGRDFYRQSDFLGPRATSTQSDFYPERLLDPERLWTQSDFRHRGWATLDPQRLLPTATSTHSDFRPAATSKSAATSTRSDFNPQRLLPTATSTHSDFYPQRLLPTATSTHSDF